MKLSIKDTADENKIVENNKRWEEYNLLIAKLKYVLQGYEEQKSGLLKREAHLKQRRNEMIKYTVIGAFLFVVLLFIGAYIPIFFAACFMADLLIFILAPLFIGSVIARCYEYATMMENNSVFVKKDLITYKGEERFLNNIISEYQEVINMDIKESDITDELILKLTRMTMPKNYYASSIYGDVKLWPLVLLTFFWSILAIVIWT
ncbi:MAG: hypothetical protein ACI4D8_02550 [Wujia sp.]